MTVLEQRMMEAIIAMSDSMETISKELRELNEKMERLTIVLGGVECVEQQQ